MFTFDLFDYIWCIEDSLTFATKTNPNKPKNLLQTQRKTMSFHSSIQLNPLNPTRRFSHVFSVTELHLALRSCSASCVACIIANMAWLASFRYKVVSLSSLLFLGMQNDRMHWQRSSPKWANLHPGSCSSFDLEWNQHKDQQSPCAPPLPLCATCTRDLCGRKQKSGGRAAMIWKTRGKMLVCQPSQSNE